jgi:transposase
MPAALHVLLKMNGPIFLNWFENQLMPALKSPSVIVLDNASYHNIKTEETASEPSTGNHM